MMCGLEAVALSKRPKAELETKLESRGRDGHVLRRDSEYVGEMEVPGKRRRGRWQRRYMDVGKENVEIVGEDVLKEGDRGEFMIFIFFSFRGQN